MDQLEQQKTKLSNIDEVQGNLVVKMWALKVFKLGN